MTKLLSAAEAASFFARLVATRRAFHRTPELSWHETNTAAKVETHLRSLGLSPRRCIPHAPTGIVCEIPGTSRLPLRHIALRADLDALPIHEQTNLPFASQVDGVMHACGHDCHTTALLGAAELLIHNPSAAPVRLIFQPAEETNDGARAMVAAGVLKDVAYIFGGHVDRGYEVGDVVVHAGAVNAANDTFTITLNGAGGHAARPHQCTDAVVAASSVVVALQTIVSRELNPAQPAVLTIGKFVAGTVANAIAESAVLDGTIRSQGEEVRNHMLDSLKRIVKSVAEIHRMEATVEVRRGPPPLINKPTETDIARSAVAQIGTIRSLLGETPNHDGRDGSNDSQQTHSNYEYNSRIVKAVPLAGANMGGEDFSEYLATEGVAGVYVRFGGRTDNADGRTEHGEEQFPAHSSRFDVDERLLPIAAHFFAHVAVEAGERLVADWDSR